MSISAQHMAEMIEFCVYLARIILKNVQHKVISRIYDKQ